jgi:hypothetical protein
VRSHDAHAIGRSHDDVGAQGELRVEWVRTRRSSASRCSGKTVTGSAASRGMATSCSSSGFVLPKSFDDPMFDSIRSASGLSEE